MEKNAYTTLIESYALSPSSVVSADYAERKGMTLKEAEKWLALYLAYDPEQQRTKQLSE